MGKAKKSRSSRQMAKDLAWRRMRNIGPMKERCAPGNGMYPSSSPLSTGSDLEALADAVISSNYSREARRRFIRAYEREVSKGGNV